jgi:hypothetical protein
VLLLVIMLVRFTGPDGGRIDVNSVEVTSVREPRGQGHFAHGTNCVVVMSNGKFIGVREGCDEVRRMLMQGKPSNRPCIYVCGEAEPRK